MFCISHNLIYYYHLILATRKPTSENKRKRTEENNLKHFLTAPRKDNVEDESSLGRGKRKKGTFDFGHTVNEKKLNSTSTSIAENSDSMSSSYTSDNYEPPRNKRKVTSEELHDDCDDAGTSDDSDADSDDGDSSDDDDDVILTKKKSLKKKTSSGKKRSSTSEPTPEPANQFEYNKQRIEAFYRDLRERSNLHICPVCTEEKSKKKFIKTPLFSGDDLPAHIYDEKANITYGNEKGVYHLSTEIQTLLKPLLKVTNDELDFSLLSNYTLCPFLKVFCSICSLLLF